MNDTEFKKIMEAVNQGIVASKQSESKFWGEWKDWRKEKDQRDSVLHDSLIEIFNEIKGLKEAKLAQNGRLARCEDNIINVNTDIVSAKGSLKAIIMVSGAFISILIALTAYIYTRTESNVDKLTDLVHEHLTHEI